MHHHHRPTRSPSVALGRLALLGVVPCLLFLGGCNELKITPPKPNKGGRAGEGPALAIGDSTKKKKGRRETAQEELGRLMRDFDDDIAAWHQAYASRNRLEQFLEGGLTRRAEQYYDTLVDALRGDNVPFAMVAATAVAFSNREEVASTLLGVAGSRDTDVRVVENSLNGLGILASRNPLARESIQGAEVSRFLADERPEVRRAASFLAMNLVSRGDDRGLLPYLAEGTGDQDYMVRANCSWAIGRAAMPGSVGLLEVALASDETQEVRCNAALALAATADAGAVPVLIQGLDDKDTAVRRHCVTALSLLTEERHGADKAAWSSWWAANRATFVPRVIDRQLPPADE